MNNQSKRNVLSSLGATVGMALILGLVGCSGQGGQQNDAEGVTGTVSQAIASPSTSFRNTCENTGRWCDGSYCSAYADRCRKNDGTWRNNPTMEHQYCDGSGADISNCDGYIRCTWGHC